MAMDKAAMAQLILDKIKARNPENFDSGEEDLLKGYLEDFCEGIIEHIIAAAVVTVEHSGPRTGSVTA